MDYLIDALLIEPDLEHLPDSMEEAFCYEELEMGRDRYEGTVTVVGLAS